jgi:spore germination protein GerM
VRRIAVLTGITLVAVACGVPRTGEFETIERGNVPFDLANTTVPSTTTTTTTSTTLPDASSTTAASTSTTIPTEIVRLYFVAGRQVIPVEVPIARPASPPQVLSQLVAGPRFGEVGQGIRTVIPRNAEMAVVVERGTATIDLPGSIFDDVPSRDLTLLFGQLVLTIGQLGGVGQVTFTLDGEPTGAVLADGSTTEAGALVTAGDYVGTLTGEPPTTTSTTIATPPASEVPTPSV